VTTPSGMSGPSDPEPSLLDLQGTSQPPRKRPWLIILVIFLAFMMLGIVGWVAILSSADKALKESVTEASPDATASQPANGRTTSGEVRPGKGFTLGNHKTLPGWKVAKDSSLGETLFSVTGNVKNVSDAKSTALIHFKFLNEAGEILGTVQCNSADLEPGQVQALNCIPDGKYRQYTTVTAELAAN
jgi:hypothetical protein